MALTKRQIEESHVKPALLKPNLEAIPPQLKALPRWILWRWDWSHARACWTKVPYTSHYGEAKCSEYKKASSTNPATWSPWEKIIKEWGLRSGNFAPGFVLTEEDNITAFDFDDSRNPETGELTPLAEDAIRRLNSYAEVSPSGTGVKGFVFGRRPADRGKKNPKLHVEIYNDKRFMAMTGLRVDGTPPDVMERQAEVDALCRELMPYRDPSEKVRTDPSGKVRIGQWRDFFAGRIDTVGVTDPHTGVAHDLAAVPEDAHAAVLDAAGRSPVDPRQVDPQKAATVRRLPLPGSARVSLSDLDIIEKASRAKGGERFQALWSGNTCDYGSRSEADIALARRLLFWCGPDPDRVERLMLMSGLVRDKWLDRSDYYLPVTIANAMRGVREYYDPDRPLWPRRLQALPHKHTPTVEETIRLTPEQEAARREQEAEQRRQLAACQEERRLAEQREREERRRAERERVERERAELAAREGADHERLEAERRAERQAAARIRRERADYENNVCCNKCVLAQRHIRDGTPRVIYRRCEARGVCAGCTRYLYTRDAEHLRFRLGAAARAGQRLYWLGVAKSPGGDGPSRCAWEALRKEIKRRPGGQWAIVDPCDDDGFVLAVTNVPVTNAQPYADFDAAIRDVEDHLRRAQEAGARRRPLRTSHGWRLPRDYREPEWVMTPGCLPDQNLTPADLGRLASVAGCMADVKYASEPGRARVQAVVTFERDDGHEWENAEGRTRREHLEFMLMLGEEMSRELAIGDIVSVATRRARAGTGGGRHGGVDSGDPIAAEAEPASRARCRAEHFSAASADFDADR